MSKENFCKDQRTLPIEYIYTLFYTWTWAKNLKSLLSLSKYHLPGTAMGSWSFTLRNFLQHRELSRASEGGVKGLGHLDSTISVLDSYERNF